MPHFAIINGSDIVNVIVADDLETANNVAKAANIGELAVEVPNEPDSPGIGWTYDRESLSFTAPIKDLS